MSNLRNLGDVATVVAGFGFSETYQGRTTLPTPFIKVSDFATGKDSWLSTAANTVDRDILKALRAKTYPAGTVVFPKVGGALLTNKRARLAVEATFDNNVMGLIPTQIDGDYLFYFMRSFDMARIANTQSLPSVRASDVSRIEIPVPRPETQRQIATRLKAQLAEVETAWQASQMQLRELTKLANSIIYDSIKNVAPTPRTLGDVLDEVKKGIGQSWKKYPVLGATRGGLAPAKEQPGKQAPKYKPAFPGTVFYNPMRILIGSIAFVDDDDTPGITSPDYVALRGKEGVVDSRWFYHWLRSPLGEQCILSLARGAVRERMLFNRLAEGAIQLPDFAEQERASTALNELRPLRQTIEQQLREIDLLPKKILAQAFDQ